MKFAIINDIHMSAPDTGYESGVQRKLVGESERLIRQFVDEMNNHEHPKFVVNLGDTIEDVKDKEGDTFYFKKAVSLLSQLKMPVYFLIGNHDVKSLSEAEIAKILGYKSMYYSFDSGGYHFVALSFVQNPKKDKPDDIDRQVAKEQMQWLKKDLAKTDKPTIVFSHYGLADDDMEGNFWFETIPEKAVIKNRQEVRDVISWSGKVIAVISAHQHWNRMLVHGGIPYIIVTSLIENFKNDGLPAEAHTIVTLEKDKILVDIKGNDPARFEYLFRSVS